MTEHAKHLAQFVDAEFSLFRDDDPLMNFLGDNSIAKVDGAMVLRVACNPQAANRLGILHGGMLSAVCDVAMYEAAKLVLQSECVTLSQEMKFLRSGKVGDPLYVVAEIEKPGRRIVFTKALVLQNNKKIAASTAQCVPVAA